MAKDDLVVVKTFSSRLQADVAKTALDAAGIQSMVVADDAGGMQPGLWESQGVGVAVNRNDREAALDVLSVASRTTE